MLDDHHGLQLVDVAHQVTQVVVRRRDLCQTERLPQVAHVEVHLPGVRPLGKDVGPEHEEGVVGAKAGVELLVGGVGGFGVEEVAAQGRVVGVGGGVVDPQRVGVPSRVTPVCV